MIKQITVFMKNEPGSLFNITSTLAKADVDIRAITLAETSDFGLLRIVPTPFEKALKVLDENNIKYVEHEVFAVEVKDQPGGLAEFAQLVAKNKINIEYTYPFVTRESPNAFLVLKATDVNRAKVYFQKSGVKQISEEDFYKI